MKRRVGLALVIAAALGGLAAGLIVGRGHSANAAHRAKPGVVAKGTFHAITWNTTGTVSVVRQANGDLRLRLSSDFTTKHAPELYLYLAKLNGQRKLYWKQVAPLRSTRGGQAYAVSADAVSKPGLEVAIYCGECNQINALAPLAPVTQS